MEWFTVDSPAFHGIYLFVFWGFSAFDLQLYDLLLATTFSVDGRLGTFSIFSLLTSKRMTDSSRQTYEHYSFPYDWDLVISYFTTVTIHSLISRHKSMELSKYKKPLFIHVYKRGEKLKTRLNRKQPAWQVTIPSTLGETHTHPIPSKWRRKKKSMLTTKPLITAWSGR